MHYAAASKDGGHYLKILGKAGADPMLTDNVSKIDGLQKPNLSFRKVELAITIDVTPSLI